MRKRFTLAFYAMSATAMVTMGLGLTATTANATTHTKKDTVACGSACISIFSDQLGSSTTMNAFVPGDTGAGGKIGQKVNMHVAGNFRPNGDFVPSVIGQVFQFCGFFANDFFSPTSYVCLHYPFFEVFEAEWSPNGNSTGLCAGVAVAGVNNESVTLRPCGSSSKTLWIADRTNGTGGDCRTAAVPPVPAGGTANFCPWVNASDTSFSDPLVLTLNTGTQNPTNQLMISRELLVGGIARTNQLFSFFFGPVV
jgi:hypothetical protein